MRIPAWVHTRRGATGAALVGVLVIRALLNLPDWLPPGRVRAWMYFEMPFGLPQPLDSFWAELLLVFASFVFVLWASRRPVASTILPLGLTLLCVDVLLGLASDTALVLGTRQVALRENLSVPGASWDLLPYDMQSTVLCDVSVIGPALICALAAMLLWRRRVSNPDPAARRLG